jgi:hypothetical protein
MINLKKTTSRLSITWILVFLFALPIVAAQGLYFFRDHVSFNTVETGTLLSPPLATKTLSFFDPKTTGKWQLVYVQPSACGTHCQNTLTDLKRIQAALGKESHRVLCRTILNTELPSFTPGTLAVIDPQGWLILHYPSSNRPMGIIKDLQRLLKFSHAG